MATEVICPCGKTYTVAGNEIEKTLLCDQCQATLTIPTGIDSSLEEEIISSEDAVALPKTDVAHWYYVRGGQACGPIPETDLSRLVQEGGVEAGDLVWRPGDTTSRPLGQYPEFAALLAMLPATSSSIRSLEKRLTLREHLEAIEDMVKRKCRSETEYLLMAGGGGASAFGATAFAGQAGMLHSDVFGGIRSGGSPFVIGQTGQMGQPGILSSDVFGNIRADNSPFTLGQTGRMGQPGPLHTDVFGNIFSGNSPFTVGQV